MNYADAPRPFKNPAYQSKASSGKRNKTLKQVVTIEKEGERERIEKDPSCVTFSSVEAPPSILPQKRYCDVTGLEAPYKDPKSTLRYHNVEVYDVIKSFQPAVIQAYLASRGSGVVLR
ncbi:hypothetical protein MNV49_003940 [Pseudohyphozyma bogoriensis]|nr:hypothetical protein MNV49_003940 [Pseudohyphozyma bogoriensis]